MPRFSALYPSTVLSPCTDSIRLGVTRVYLWDNKSVPPMNATIEAHIASGFVAYNYFDRFTHPTGAPQLFAYDRCRGGSGVALLGPHIMGHAECSDRSPCPNLLASAYS